MAALRSTPLDAEPVRELALALDPGNRGTAVAVDRQGRVHLRWLGTRSAVMQAAYSQVNAQATATPGRHANAD